MSRILRCVVCFLLICCILVNCSPLRADATAAGAAGVITGAATVSVSAPMVIVATLIALGLHIGVNGTDGIEAVAQSAVSHLESAGTYIKDGCVELLQTVNSAGEKAYYVAGDFMESVRSSVADDVLYIKNQTDIKTLAGGSQVVLVGSQYFKGTNLRVYKFVWLEGYLVNSLVYAFCDDDRLSFSNVLNGSFLQYSANKVRCSSTISTNETNYQTALTKKLNAGYVLVDSFVDWDDIELYTPVNFPYDITLASFPSQSTDLTDGTSARAWSEPMTNNGLKVIEGGGSDPEPPDENNGKWFWPLALTVTAADLWAMSQADEWSGKTPQEFDDYRTQTEFEILSRPEVEFGQGIEIAPVTSPSPDPGTNPNPGTNPDQDGSEEVKTDYTTWFSRLYTSVENIAGKFDEIPNKFQSWISDLKTDIQTQTDKLAEHASNTLAAIQSLPESFAESLADLKSAVLSVPNSIKEFFTPKQPSNHTQFALGDLSKFFPFCIPFDLFDFFTLLDADPVAPVFSWEIQDLSGQTYGLTVDLSQWDSVAQLFRRLQLFLFVCGLAAASRKFIKW